MRRIESEQGSILIEVLVSAIMLVITAVGVFSAFDAGTRSSAEERHRAQAEGLAQADIARLRTMRISDLSNLLETKTVNVEGNEYTVKSSASYQTDSNSTASCKPGEASADYVEIRSEVTWPSLGSRAPVVEQSLVAPPNGSISAESGSLAVQIENAKAEGVAGVVLNGTGAGTFAGETGPTGCVVFGDLPAGNYTLTLSGSGLVDSEGDPPEPQETSVVEESTNTLGLQYDFGGTIEASFQTYVGGELVPSQAESIVVFNSGMHTAKVFGTEGEPREAISATPLFPFVSAYSVYSGRCTAHNPAGGEISPEGAVGEALVSAKATTPVTITLPPLNVNAWSGPAKEEEGKPVEGARVTVTDENCAEKVEKEGGEAEPEEIHQVRTYATDAEGHLADPGLPFSTYAVCVSAAGKRVEVAELELPENPEDLEAGSTVNAYLGSPAALEGECP
jgi:Tfp pilus assembly protein PilV